MSRKQLGWKTKGMNKDLSVSAFNPEFAFENMNLRLSTNEHNTLLSWVNEKGTSSIDIVAGDWEDGSHSEAIPIEGTPIGTAVINHKLVLFTVDGINSIDRIYVLTYASSTKTTMLAKRLFEGDLSFSTIHPIETLVSYESENIQKVYWTDGVNQPRVINIAGTIKKDSEGNYINTQFDFVPTLQLKEEVQVQKQLGATGTFAPGVIQYSLTYYNKYGQESNIFYTSPLLYISHKDRGASPEDKVENAFKIIVTNVDTNFDYLRIYSIQRTSIDATPICKRVQDIEINNASTLSYIDTGMSGDSIDPTELLYKGGEVISAETINQKDNTLFLGNIKVKREYLETDTDITGAITIEDDVRMLVPTKVSSEPYAYYNQLTSAGNIGELMNRFYGKTVPCGGFKLGDTYRLGVQFQHESGKWSDPIFKEDKICGFPSDYSSDIREANGNIYLPIFKGALTSEEAKVLQGKGYKRVRAVVVFPGIMDRNVLCQGVACPTLYTKNHRDNKDLYAQSSWFFRPTYYNERPSGGVIKSPVSSGILPYTNRNVESNKPDTGAVYNPSDIRSVEIEGTFTSGQDAFQVEKSLFTLHSPDIEFDEQLYSVNFVGVSLRKAGYVSFKKTLSDINIQTETPTISKAGSGFVHKSFTGDGASGIISGLFYDDYMVDDDTENSLRDFVFQKASCKWLVYPWQGTGSLNNDINRPANLGVTSSLLKKKVISNLRYTTSYLSIGMGAASPYVELFSGNEDTIIKINDKIYKGNIDTMLTPENADGKYFAWNGVWEGDESRAIDTPFDSDVWCKTFSKDRNIPDENGMWKWEQTERRWNRVGDHLGDSFVDLVIKKSPVRMRYKSSPHLVVNSNILNNHVSTASNPSTLAIIEVRQSPTQPFGGTSEDALKENVWLPCGESVSLDNVRNGYVEFYYDYGDTYYQRYDCLKTYAWSDDDINQVVEIGSFMLDTRINIDGRYDRNRGQLNNLNMSPRNFNLINPVYSQKDNFFSYRILDKDYYINNVFPNQVTWTKTKTSGADIDQWTNMTLASTLELDGNKGKVTSIQRLNDQLICFQDSGISQILYNENTQISTTEGVPIEIANSGKVQGRRYLSNTIGCSNKWSIVTTPLGIYFMDSNEKSIYLFNGQLSNLTTSGGFNTWAKGSIPPSDFKWSPVTFRNFVSFYDRLNQDVLFVNSAKALAYSEKVGAFTSFYDYGNTPFFCNLDDTGIWIRPSGGNTALWKHQGNEDYCTFFGEEKPYWTILIGNQEPQLDKIFTNLEFRACIDGEGSITDNKYHPFLPFDRLETWNEYQQGLAYLKEKDGHSAMVHHSSDKEASLKRKFRIWRCDIPRDNVGNSYGSLSTFDYTFDYTFRSGSNSRVAHPLDRMRNPWLYLKLTKTENTSRRVELHDMIMTYFG